MSNRVFRITFVCPRCGDTHVHRGPVEYCMYGAAYLIDHGSPMVTVADEGFMQEADMDFAEWLEHNGIDVGESELIWGGFSHRAGGRS